MIENSSPPLNVHKMNKEYYGEKWVTRQWKGTFNCTKPANRCSRSLSNVFSQAIEYDLRVMRKDPQLFRLSFIILKPFTDFKTNYSNNNRLKY